MTSFIYLTSSNCVVFVQVCRDLQISGWWVTSASTGDCLEEGFQTLVSHILEVRLITIAILNLQYVGCSMLLSNPTLDSRLIFLPRYSQGDDAVGENKDKEQQQQQQQPKGFKLTPTGSSIFDDDFDDDEINAYRMTGCC